MFKKRIFITIPLAIIILVTSIFQSFAAVETISGSEKVFKDISKDFWAYEAIAWMNKIGAINGFKDGTFRPDENVTRAQFAAIVVKCIKLDGADSSKKEFADVSADSWAANPVQAINTYLTWFKIGNENYFRPDEEALRVDIAVAIAKILSLKTDIDVEGILKNYSDGNQVSAELKKYVAATIENKIFNGFSTNSNMLLFKPASSLTRAQIVQVLFNALVKNKLAGDRVIQNPLTNSVDSVVVDTYKVVVDNDENYVAKVGEDKITQSEYYFFLKQIKSQMEMAAARNGVDTKLFWTTKINDKDPKELAIESTLNQLKEYKTELKQAEISKFIFSSEDKVALKTSFDSLVEKNGGETVVNSKLAKEFGISLAAYEKVFYNGKLIDKFMNAKEKTMSVTDEEVIKHYSDNKEKYETVTVSHVLFMILDQKTNSPLSQEKQDLAKKKADDVLAKVMAGEDITSLAKQLSEDPGVKENNGEYSFQKNGQMVKEFQDWAFSKKVGDSGIVKTDFGYHVMKKTKVSGLEDVKDFIKQELQRNSLIELLKQWKADPNYPLIKQDRIFNALSF